MAEKKKFKSKLRDKFKAADKREKAGGRSLALPEASTENYYGDYKEVTLPKSQRAAFNERLKSAMQNRAKEVLGGGKKTVKSTLADGAKEIHKGLTGIRHPAQLIPTIERANSLGSIIKALTKK